MRKIALAVAASLVLCQAIASAQDLAGRTIAAVNIQGLERVSEQVVRARLAVQAGQDYDQRAISDDVRRLYETGFFNTVKADAAIQDGSVVLTYIVEEKRVISEVQIIGNSKINDRRIRAVLEMREGDSFVPDAFAQERDAILELYEGKGFANTTVEMVAEKVGPSRVRLTYMIEEGKKARIRSIEIRGNDVLTDRRIKKQMDTSRGWWILGGKYEEEEFEQDLIDILDTYGNYGRLEAEIPKTDLVYTDSGKGMDITIYLDEGPEYQVDTLEIADNEVFDDDELVGIVEVEAGEVHDAGQVEEDAAIIEQGYRSSGYVNADVTPQVTVDRENKTTRVAHQVEEGQLKYIREVNITGNEVTKDEVIRRQMLLEPGDRFDGEALEASQRNIQNTRYFENVRPSLQDYEMNDLYTDLVLNVEEGKTGTFNFGAGYSTEEGIGGFAELRLSNFDISNWPTFSGGGQELNLKLNIGEVREEYSLSFTDPEILGYPLSFGFDIFDESYDVPGAGNYQEEVQGVQLRLGKMLSPYVTVRGGIRYEETYITELPFFVNRELRRQRGSTTTVSGHAQIERNTLDSYRDPTDGARHTFATQVAGFGGDNEFVKIEHDSIWFEAIDDEGIWVLSFRTREGFVTEYGGSDWVPLQDRFYAGGSNSVRGYDVREIGPMGREFGFWGDRFALGGDLRLITNLELKYKVNDMVRLYTFVDSGGVWRDASDFSFSDMKHSAGLGLGFDVPHLGPIRVDYGFPINPEDFQGSGNLHLTTGFAF